MKNLLNHNIHISGQEYLIVPGNNKKDKTVSFLNTKTENYIRHYDSNIIESDHTLNEDFFYNDSSFYFERKGLSYIFKCYNVDLYISKEKQNNFAIGKIPHYFYLNKIDISNIFFKEIIINEEIFTIIPGYSKELNTVSFFSKKSNLSIRHFNGEIIKSDQCLNNKKFIYDATFYPEQHKYKYAFRCSNPEMEKLYILPLTF